MTEVPQARAQSASSDAIWSHAFKEAGMAFLAAAAFLAIFYVFTFRWLHPEFVPFMDREATALIASGKDMIPVSVGAYRVEGTDAIIEDFNGDEAILALPRAFQAENYPFIKVNLQGLTRFSKLKILWRQANNPSQIHALELNRSGDEATQVAMVYGNKNYRGQISDIALLFFDGPALGFENNNETDIVVKGMELLPFSAWRVAEQIIEDWTNPPLWDATSNNVVKSIHTKGMLSPNSVGNLLVLVGILICTTRRAVKRKSASEKLDSPIVAVALGLCLYGWAFNDALRWHWRWEQLIDTYERYAGHPLEERIMNSPSRCSQFPSDCKSGLLPYF